jgi:chemotaxis signal transduction protein
LKFITDQGFDVYAFILEIRDILGLPPFEPTDITRMGVGIYGLIDDVYAVLPIEDLKALFDMKMKTREYFKTIVTTIRSPEFVVSIHCVSLNFVSCCLCYMHTSV